MHPDDILTSCRFSYYHAPRALTQVESRTIDENCEYVELITAGGVFFDDGHRDEYFGVGTLFWHFPGDGTISRYRAGKPYECFVAVFGIEAPHRRIAPRVTSWNLLNDLFKFTDESLRAFHDESFHRALLARSVHSRLLYEAYSSGHGTVLPGTPLVVEQALEIIERRYKEEISVEDLAKSLGISVPHLHMLFHHYLHETPHQRILVRRLQEAKNLLVLTNTNLKTLSAECGFQSVEHFCRLFKQRFHMTPSEFRLRSAPQFVSDLKETRGMLVPDQSE